MLLDGLENADRDDMGRIMGAALSRHIYNKLPMVLGAEAQEPYIEVIPQHAIVWAVKPQPMRNRVQIHIVPPQEGVVEVRGPDLDLLGTFPAREPIHLVGLSSGVHTLVFPNGLEQGFDVVGATEVMSVVVNLDALRDQRVVYARF